MLLSIPILYTLSVHLGNAILTLKHKDPIKIATIRSTAFPPAEAGGGAAVENSKSINPP